MIAPHCSRARAPVDCAAFSMLLERRRSALFWRPLRDMIVAAFIVLSASAIVYAGERLQDWIPGVLAIPADAQVVTDRAIGSTARMFSISTAADVEMLFAEWEKSLSANGYQVTQTEGEISERTIVFSGPDIANAKIVLAPIRMRAAI